MKRLCAVVISLLCLFLPGVLTAQVVSGTITTIAGTGTRGFSGDRGPATQASISLFKSGVAVDARGNVYIADSNNNRVRRVSPDGIITTFAGTATGGFSGDGGPATQAGLTGPWDVAVDLNDVVYIADTANGSIRRVGLDGIITTIAGTGTRGFSGDGGPATQAQLMSASGVAVDAKGNVYIAEYADSRVRRVSPDGIITTIAGTGTLGFSGDRGPATQAQLSYAQDVAVDAKGNIYIADLLNHRIRRVGSDGIITTIAGTGASGSFGGGFSGDGGLAVEANLNAPTGVAVDARGNVYIADSNNNRVRRVSPDGIITTFAGTGASGFSGDGGPATQAQLNNPWGVAVDAKGNVYITDTLNQRVRRVEVQTPAISLSVLSLTLDNTNVGSTSQKTFTISNTGTGSLSVTGITVGGTDALQFRISPTTATVAAGGSQTVTVTFAPTSVGSKSASLSIVHNAAGSPSAVSLTGAGTAAPAPVIGLSASSLAFDATTAGQSSQKTFTISNTGNASLSVTGITVGGTDAAQFRVSPTTATVAAGGSQTIAVTFAPTSAGSKSASLSIVHNAAGSPSSVALSGTGTAAPVVDTTPPVVTSSSPPNGAQGVDPATFNSAGIAVTFSEAIDTRRIQISVRAGTRTLTWQPAWSEGDTRLTLRPAEGSELGFETEYRVTLSQVADRAGNAGAETAIVFTTRAKPAPPLPPPPVGGIQRHRAVVIATVTQDGVPVSGLEVAFSRSVSGRAADYSRWKGTTDVSGRVVIEIVADPGTPSWIGVSGYYLARAINPFSGAVMGRWRSIPINGGRETTLSLPVGGQASIESYKWLPAAKPAVDDAASAETPVAFDLHPNFPNPFNPETMISFDLPADGWANLSVYNLNGQQVRVLVEGERSAGRYMIRWDGRDDAGRPVGTGVYFYRLRTGEWSAVQKMTLVR